MMIALALAVSVWYGTYSVIDAGKAGAPKLTAIEYKWLDLIRRTPAYSRRWGHLRFKRREFAMYQPGQIVTPLIVIDIGDWRPGMKGAVRDPQFHVIGEPCSAWYALVEGRYTGTTSASCEGPNSAWPPIPGENVVLLHGHVNP